MMKYIYFVMLIQILLSCNENKKIDKPESLLNYSIIDENFNDFSELEVKVITNDTLLHEKKKEVRDLLEYLYFDLKNNNQSKDLSKNQKVKIFLYSSVEKSKTENNLWIGLISGGDTNFSPSIEIDTSELNSQNIKWNLDYDTRIKIFNEIILAERKANDVATKKYPLENGYLPKKTAKKIGVLMEKLNQDYNKEIINKYNLKENTLDSITLEGLKSKWSMPID